MRRHKRIVVLPQSILAQAAPAAPAPVSSAAPISIPAPVANPPSSSAGLSIIAPAPGPSRSSPVSPASSVQPALDSGSKSISTKGGLPTDAPPSSAASDGDQGGNANMKDSSNAGQIAGGVIGGIVGLTLLIVIVVCCIRRSSRKRREDRQTGMSQWQHDNTMRERTPSQATYLAYNGPIEEPPEGHESLPSEEGEDAAEGAWPPSLVDVPGGSKTRMGVPSSESSSQSALTRSAGSRRVSAGAFQNNKSKTMSSVSTATSNPRRQVGGFDGPARTMYPLPQRSGVMAGAPPMPAPSLAASHSTGVLLAPSATSERGFIPSVSAPPVPSLRSNMRKESWA